MTSTRSRKYLLLGMSGFMATRVMIWLIPLIAGHSRSLYADIGWDDSWYRLIATDGYDHGIGPIRTAVSHLNPTGLRHSNLAFFPAYPMAMRAVSALGFNEVWAAALVHIAQRKQWRQALVASALAPLGWIGYVAFVAVRTGRWNGYLLVQREWHSGMDWGRTILKAIQRSLFDTQQPFPTMAIWLVLFAIILTMVLMVTRAPLPLLAYTLVSMFFVIVQTDFLKPRERFLLVIFPLLIPIARLLNRARASIVVGVLCTFAVLSTVVGNVLLNQRWSP